MLKKIIIFFLSVLMTFGNIPVVSASANNEIIVFGGSQYDYYTSVASTPDGNLVAVGHSNSTDYDMQGLSKGYNDAIIVKYDSSGNVLWKKSFGGSNNDDYYTSVTSTPDGNLVAVGYSYSTNGDMQGLNKGVLGSSDAIIVKYDSSGNVLWKKSFGGSGYDEYYSVTSTPDGNLVAVGYSGSTDKDMQGLNKGGVDAIIVKYDPNGKVLWKKSFGGSSNDYYESVTLTPDDNLVAVGYFYSTSRSSFIAIIVKYDLNGNVLWEKSFGGGGNDHYYSVASTPDGNLVAVGYSESTDGSMRGLNKGNYDAIIVKYNLADGKEMWKKSFGGSGGDYYTSVASTPDGNLVAVGYSGSTDKDMQGLNKNYYGIDAIIVKHNLNDGEVMWKKSFGGGDTDRYHSVTTTSDGDLVAVGYSSSNSGDMQGLNQGGSDAIIVKYDPNGNIVPFSDSAPEPASFSADITDQGVIVTINYPEQAVVRQYKINDGDWLDYTSPVVMTQNGTIYARGQAANGMWSEISTYVVSNIVDEEDPVGEGPGENDPEEEGPDAGNPIGSHPISCNTDGMCNILPGMNKIHKTKYILAQRSESVDITTLVPSNYDFISTLWN